MQAKWLHQKQILSINSLVAVNVNVNVNVSCICKQNKPIIVCVNLKKSYTDTVLYIYIYSPRIFILQQSKYRRGQKESAGITLSLKDLKEDIVTFRSVFTETNCNVW